MKKPKILVVDDNTKIQYAFQTFLEKEGYISIPLSEGADVLTIIAREKPTMVFLDISLPDQDGLEILRKIKKVEPSLPVIIVSGHITDENRARALALGALDFLEKPLSLAKIRQLLH